MLTLVSIGLLSLAWNIQSVRALAASNIVVTTHADNKVLKLDSEANVIWNIDVGPYPQDAVVNPNDGTIYVISSDWALVASLTKLDPDGNILWSKDISFMAVPGVGGPCTVDVDPMDGSAYVVASGAPGYPFGVYKYSSAGNLLWSRSVNFQSVAVNPTDGTIYINDCFEGVFKYDSNGNLIWQSAVYGGAGYGSESIKVNPFDGSVVASYRFGDPIVKLDTNGQLVWKTDTGTDQIEVAIDPYRNAVYLTSRVYEYDWYGPHYLYKLDLTTGEIVWTRYISHTLSDGLAVDYQDGSIYVGDWNGTLHKMNPNDGSIVWSKNLGYIVCRISVENVLLQPPIASFTYSPLDSYVGETVTFDASTSYDPDGSIISYLWDFGDGSAGNGVTTSHVYGAGGTYTVALTIIDNDGLNSTTTTNVTVLRTAMNVQVKAGSIHFRGEIAEFYILVSSMGKPIDANITATLYYNGTLYANLSTSVEHVSLGLYRTPYTIPSDAPSGTYVLVANASYLTLSGISLESFLLSPTFTGWNPLLVAINGTTATIKTDLGLIMVKLDAINATVTRIEGTTATIQTTLGVMNGTITSVKDNIATVVIPGVGQIETDISNLKGTQETWTIPVQYIITALALIAAASSTLSIILIRRRKTT